MEAPHVEEELLQRYFDGDLQGASAASVTQHISGCTDCKRRHTALSELHKLMVMSADHVADGVDFDLAFANIERATRERPAPSLLERLTVWWRDLVEQRPEQLWAPALGAVLAGGLLLFVLRDSTRDKGEVVAANPPKPLVPVTVPGTVVPGSQPPGAPGAQGAGTLPPDALALANTEVVQVDFGSNAGTVYEIALAGGVSTPVVWINDDDVIQ